jgi:hypothetical protein
MSSSVRSAEALSDATDTRVIPATASDGALATTSARAISPVEPRSGSTAAQPHATKESTAE